MSQPAQMTQLLTDWRNGNQEAGSQLWEVAYDELRRMAGNQLRRERPGHTLAATALVNELYLRLFAGEPIAWQDRAHFFAVAARQLRRLLVNHARDRRAQKRGGECVRLGLSDVHDLGTPAEPDLLELDQALSRLEHLDARAAQVIELRFFAGLTERESAEALGISVATLKRDWDFARAWLLAQLSAEAPSRNQG